MSRILFRYATPILTVLFAVSLVSGVALFFHLGGGVFKGMHEWLSLALALPFVLHLWRNWRPFANYFRHAPMTVALVLGLGAAAAFAIPAAMNPSSGGPPQFAFAHQIAGNAAADVAPLLGMTPEGLVARLDGLGFTAADPGLSLVEIATRSGRSERDVVAALVVE